MIEEILEPERPKAAIAAGSIMRSQSAWAPLDGPEGALRIADGGKQPSTRRRHLLALEADPDTVHMATRSRKGYWRMSQNEIVRFALNNRWLEEQGVPDMNARAL